MPEDFFDHCLEAQAGVWGPCLLDKATFDKNGASAASAPVGVLQRWGGGGALRHRGGGRGLS